jgi:hypothetical protein
MSQASTAIRLAHIDYIKELVDTLAGQEHGGKWDQRIGLADIIKRELDTLVRPAVAHQRRWTDSVQLPS